MCARMCMCVYVCVRGGLALIKSAELQFGPSFPSSQGDSCVHPRLLIWHPTTASRLTINSHTLIGEQQLCSHLCLSVLYTNVRPGRALSTSGWTRLLDTAPTDGLL